jgi:nucleotide-binding universal stress UspA family protein
MKPPGRVRRMKIACAVDLHEDGGRVALDAAFLARTLDARLAMIHALPRLDEGVILFAAGDDLPSTLNENAARRELASICPPSQECPDPLITRGEPPQAIRNALRKLDADLLVVGPGRQPPGEMKLGSHVFDIVRPAAVHDAEIAHDRDCAAA